MNPFALQRLRRDTRRREFLRDNPSDVADSSEGIRNAIESGDLNPIEAVERQGTVFADGQLVGEMVELTDAANRTNTTFYTMDPRGLISGPDVDYNVPLEEWGEYIRTTRSTLRSLAELTGGISIANTNNFDDLLAEIDAETSDYYVLGYYTNNPDSTDRTRELNISVNRDSVTVRSRESYTFSRNAVQSQSP